MTLFDVFGPVRSLTPVLDTAFQNFQLVVILIGPAGLLLRSRGWGKETLMCRQIHGPGPQGICTNITWGGLWPAGTHDPSNWPLGSNARMECGLSVYSPRWLAQNKYGTVIFNR